MKINFITDLASYAKDKSPDAPLILDNGTQMVTMSISGSDALSAMCGFIAACFKACEDSDKDKILYLSSGNLKIASGGASLTMALGVEGISDLEARLNAAKNDNLLKTEVPAVNAKPEVVIENE